MVGGVGHVLTSLSSTYLHPTLPPPLGVARGSGPRPLLQRETYRRRRARSGADADRMRAVTSAGVSGAPTPLYPTIEGTVGNTPLVRLQRLPGPRTTNKVLLKLEGNNPAGSVKDRPALSMIRKAEERGQIKPGDTLIEATSGNTGIALAMAAAIRGYRIILIMPDNMSEERRQAMSAYGAELLGVPAGKMEMARDLAKQMEAEGKGVVLDQFSNGDNPAAHFGPGGTGEELWRDTDGQITHFVSSMGTTGTIMGTGRYLKGKNESIQIVGLQPSEGAQIAGIRRWPKEYLPSIFDASGVDRVMDITQEEAEDTMRALASVEGVFAGVSSGGAVSAALRLSEELGDDAGATICAIVCDRGDRYLSTGCYNPALSRPRPTNVADFWPAVRRLAGRRDVYVLFTAGADSERADGASWCPDCRRANGAIEAAVRGSGKVLLVVDVGQRPEWKSPDHPFRLDPDLGVSCVPTLAKWDGFAGPGGMKVADRLGAEFDGKDPAECTYLVQAFVAKHG